MQKPSLGRIVLIKVPGKLNGEQKTEVVIPAIIVKVWNDTMINVAAFNDGMNDIDKTDAHVGHFKWFTSLQFDTLGEVTGQPGLMKWIWPPKI